MGTEAATTSRTTFQTMNLKMIFDEEQDAANRKRLEEIKKKREADKIKREAEQKAAAEAEKKKAEEAAKKDQPKADYSEVHTVLRKVMAEGKTMSLNQLNQDAACKKNLKPALKKANVKTLNKKALEDICKGQKEFSVS